MKKIIQNDLTAMLLKLLVAYGVLFALRVVFYTYNYDSLGSLTWDEVPLLLKGCLIFDSANVAYTMGLWMVLSLLPLRSREKSWYRTMVGIVYGLGIGAFVFFNSCDTVYFHYARKRATIEEFAYADNSNTWDVMLKATGENWEVLLAGLVIFGLGLWGYIKIPYRSTRIKSKTAYYIACSVIFVVGVFCLVTMMRGGVGRAIRPISLSNAAQYSVSPQKAHVVLSNPFCILRTIEGKSIKYTKYYDTVPPKCSPFHATHAEAIGQKNVVIFIMESLSWEHSAFLAPQIHAKAGNDFMPFMDSLMREGYTMHQGYANGAKSIDALPSILASIPSYRAPFTTMPQSLNPIQGLGGALKEQGYSTWFFNGSEESSMGFVAFAKLAGFDNIRTREQYEKACGTKDFDGFWGIWDAPFMQFMARELNTAPEPFIAATFTLTNHHPFVVPESMEASLPKGHTKAHRTVAYTDDAVRQFMEYAKGQKWYNNTLFVFVADHVSSEVYAPVTKTVSGSSHIVFFMYTPDGSLRGQNNFIASQVDIMPTVLGIVGYDKPYFAFGRDLRLNDSLQNSPPMAVNYRSEIFQILVDGTAYFFNETNLTSAHSLEGDPMQTKNILGVDPVRDSLAKELIQSSIQNYYQQIEKGDFRPRGAR